MSNIIMPHQKRVGKILKIHRLNYINKDGKLKRITVQAPRKIDAWKMVEGMIDFLKRAK